MLTTIWNKYAPTKSYFGLSRDTVRAKLDELDALLEHMADSKRGYSADMLTREQIIVLLLDWRFGIINAMRGDLGPAYQFLAELGLATRKNCTGCQNNGDDQNNNNA